MFTSEKIIHYWIISFVFDLGNSWIQKEKLIFSVFSSDMHDLTPFHQKQNTELHLL